MKELGHIVFYVKNLEASRRFYGDLLGWREILNAPGAAAYSSGRTKTAQISRTPRLKYCSAVLRFFDNVWQDRPDRGARPMG
jgi:catechol 2,3-dioxygenase-like lactoylglutathione lyase family enzyme